MVKATDGGRGAQGARGRDTGSPNSVNGYNTLDMEFVALYMELPFAISAGQGPSPVVVNSVVQG